LPFTHAPAITEDDDRPLVASAGVDSQALAADPSPYGRSRRVTVDPIEFRRPLASTNWCCGRPSDSKSRQQARRLTQFNIAWSATFAPGWLAVPFRAGDKDI